MSHFKVDSQRTRLAASTKDMRVQQLQQSERLYKEAAAAVGVSAAAMRAQLGEEARRLRRERNALKEENQVRFSFVGLCSGR